MSIAENTPLFSLLGTTYGGDGVSTFALPDLRGRVPISQGQGPGFGNQYGNNQPGNRGRGNRPWGPRQGMDRRDGDKRDPLGRLMQDGTGGLDESGQTEVPEEMEQARTRAIQDELRRRGAERTRPKPELDYIDRLLRQF